MPIKLRVRQLQGNAGETSVVEFETEADAHAWLQARPRFVDVIGVAGQTSVPGEVQARLRVAMRPLDDEERRAEAAMEAALAAEQVKRESEARKRALDEQQKHEAEMRSADPDRLMEIHWRFDAGMRLTDPADPRAIPEAAREAVMAWIAERNEWVKGRGQTVGECTVKVWPGKLPPKESDRVKEGRFVPVSHAQ